MTQIQQQFFSLTRAGLWGIPADAALFDSTTDWNLLRQLARAQSLQGVVLDGVRTLPEEKRPPRMQYLQWCATLVQMEENNRLLNRRIGEIAALYREHGVEPVLLKGQGVAQNYRIPLHRQCGDIDLYIGKKDYRRINRVLLQAGGTEEEEETSKHVAIKWQGVLVENHRIMLQLSPWCANRFIQREIEHWYGERDFHAVEMEDAGQIMLPPLEFDAVYILAHALLHFLNEGIGLRQVCDWTCLLHANRDALDHHATAVLLKKSGLEKAARVFGAVAVRYLGLPPEELPVPLKTGDEALGDWLLKDIWEGGNFGRYATNRKPRPKGYWSGKWYTFVRATRRCAELRRIAPMEAYAYPFALMVRSAQAQIYKWNKKP